MPKRTQRFRGSRTHGRGKKHGRGHGGRGGTGMAGLHKHKFKWMIKYDPDHFGRYGFTRQPFPRQRPVTINVGEVVERLDAFQTSGIAGKSGDVYDVDLTKAGFDKLLGRGQTSLPLRLTVAAASPSARKKVSAAGGEVRSPGES